MHDTDLTRRLVAETLGTALLVAIVVGSGIMGERLAGGNAAIALLGNTLATGAGLVVLILVFGPISGAHFNPVVSLTSALHGTQRWRDAVAYVPVQVGGAIVGTWLAHLMFDAPLLQASTHVRTGPGVWAGEMVATFALLATLTACGRSRPEATPYAVGLVIAAGYWFTSSTSFANPAVTIARSLTDTFSGIRPADVPGFIGAQVAGAAAAAVVFRWLFATSPARPRRTSRPMEKAAE
jgi:glycerol uptake facilitator-like aquaporin